MHNYVLKTEDFDLTIGLPPMMVDGCDGKVILESNSQLTVSCPLNFHFYPFDQQVLNTCHNSQVQVYLHTPSSRFVS